jgi:programmed cell death protein 5
MQQEVTQEQYAQIEAIKKQMLSKILTKDAAERLGRVRLGNPMLASQLELYLIQLYQSGQLRETIDDEKLKQILNVLVEKRQTKIKRK